MWPPAYPKKILVWTCKNCTVSNLRCISTCVIWICNSALNKIHTDLPFTLVLISLAKYLYPRDQYKNHFKWALLVNNWMLEVQTRQVTSWKVANYFALQHSPSFTLWARPTGCWNNILATNLWYEATLILPKGLMK